MAAEIKIYTFPFTKYGMIDDEIITISNDATVDKQRGLIYGMHLLMKKNTIMVDNREVKLMPGMVVTAEVKTGTRRIIQFFLAPLLRYKSSPIETDVYLLACHRYVERNPVKAGMVEHERYY